jgi:hypothetical protein
MKMLEDNPVRGSEVYRQIGGALMFEREAKGVVDGLLDDMGDNPAVRGDGKPV